MSFALWYAGLAAIALMLPADGTRQDQSSVKRLKLELTTPAFADQGRKDRTDLVKGLIAIVADGDAERDVRLRAVRLLGELRAGEAVVVLARHIDEIQPETIDETTIETLYPSVPALIKIGKPASREVLKEMREPMKDPRRHALAVVLGGVEGRRVGRLLLQDEIASAKTPEERRNLQAGLKAFLSMTANEATSEETIPEKRQK